MTRSLGALLLAVAAWLGWQRQAEAAAPAAAVPARLDPREVLAIIRAVNDAEHGGWFDPFDVLAVVEIESSYRPRAYRAEPRIGDASWGLMQLLLSTARDRGYQGDGEGLFEPEVNIRLGMAHLRWSWDYLTRNGRVIDKATWIASYNAGVGAVERGWRNLGYVDRWGRARMRWAS